MQALHSIPPPPPQGYPAQDTSTLGPSQSPPLPDQAHHVAPPPTPPAAQPPPPPHPDQSSPPHPHPVQQQPPHPHPVQQQPPHPHPVQQQPPHPHPVQQQPPQPYPPHQQPPYPHPALTQDQQAAQQQQYAVAHANYLQQQLHNAHVQNAHLQAQTQQQAQKLEKKNKRRNALSGVGDFLDGVNNVVNITNSLRGPQENTVIIRETQVVAPEPVAMPDDAPAADNPQLTAVPEADPELAAVAEQPVISDEGIPMEVAPECPPEIAIPQVEENVEMDTEGCEIDWTCGLCSCNE